MEEITKEELIELFENREVHFIYLYTPLCGTCQMASKMLEVTETILSIKIYKKDLNYIPEHAMNWGVQSVPALIILKEQKIIEKVFAFGSVENIISIINEHQNS
ncbi:thioredoxin family protein [Bacillus carboniphilus]|uniref:Thioredoxin family protein n=1 Tax=Bacillus carboniphilus TaxID=86663 RepID=A0ABY9JR96_9BACI|nr:thioredoxin family protein [Bacillus carboniphilus]WLR41339.1 thioredoxin family protein [Bacillus carboniphilus]